MTLIPRWKWIGAGAGFLVSDSETSSAAKPDRAQVILHVLLSIHPTYRETTNPLKLVPETWRNPYSTSTSPEWDTSVRPGLEIGQGNTNGSSGASELDGRRKAKAVFVVLGEASRAGVKREQWLMLHSAEFRLVAFLGLNEADGGPIQPLGTI